MRMRIYLLSAALFAALGVAPATAAPAPAAGAKGFVLPFPAKTQLVVQVNGFDQTRERLEKLAQAAAPDEAGMIKGALQLGLGTLLGERKMTAIPGDQRWFLTIRDLGGLVGEEPAIAVLIPVKDAKAFRETFLTADEQKSLQKGEAGISHFTGSFKGQEATLQLVERPGYVVLTPSKETAEQYAGKFEAATTETLGADVSKALLESDISVYVNMDSVNDQYGQQIQAAKQFLDFAMQQAGGAGGGINKQQQIAAAKAMFKGLFQGLDDARGVVVGFEFRPVGLGLRILGRFEDGSTTGKILKNEDLTTLADLGKLPPGQSIYAASRLSPAIMDLIKDFTQQTTAPEDDEKALAAIKAYIEVLSAAGPGGQFQTFSPPGASFTIQSFKDPAKVIDAQTKLYGSLPVGSAVQNVQLKEKPTVTEKAKTLGKFTFNEVKIVFDFEASVQELPGQIKDSIIASMKKLVGEKLTIYFGTDGKSVITSSAPNWDEAKALITAYLEPKTTIDGEASYKTTRVNLPAEASLVAVLDTSKVLVMMGGYMQTMADAIPGFPGQIPELKTAKGAPSFLGMSLSLKPEVIEANIFVPATSVVVARKVLAPVLQKIE